MKEILAKTMTRNTNGVWVANEPNNNFDYTDGAWVEKYLFDVFAKASDLSSGSYELESSINDWNTEYHLSPKRKKLLEGLTFNAEHTVLEIGCGCGAITRFLGEVFNSVIAVEGSYARANLARRRTHDLESVEVVNSRFQDLAEDAKFDAIFCIGVWEYSPSYVDGEDPFEIALEAMKSRLKPGGYLVLAIENQLGLKYFANSREDHAGTFFEGIEGYPRMNNRFETFGRREIEQRLSSIGQSIDVYYPFPDYKIPDLLLTERLFDKVNCGEMIGSLIERDYAGTKAPFFNTRLAWPVIAKNGMTADMANSFLVIVGDGSKPSMGDNLGILYNTDRRPEFRTNTSIAEGSNGQIIATKSAQHHGLTRVGPIKITHNSSNWLDGESIALWTYKALHNKFATFEDALSHIRLWWDEIQSIADNDGMLPGDYIDLTWQNAIIIDGKVETFDREFVLNESIPSRLLLARAALLWDARYQPRGLSHYSKATARSRVRMLCSALGVSLSPRDFLQVIEMEARFQHEVGGGEIADLTRKLRLKIDVPYYEGVKRKLALGRLNFQRAKNFIRRALEGLS